MAYTPINWDEITPITPTNLNKMDNQIDTNENDLRTIQGGETAVDGRITQNESDISSNTNRISTNENDIETTSILTGTINHGGTIPLPSGYTEAQCSWSVSLNSIDSSQEDQSFTRINCSANSNRVVTCEADYYDDGGGFTDTITGTANYIIIGVKKLN